MKWSRYDKTAYSLMLLVELSLNEVDQYINYPAWILLMWHNSYCHVCSVKYVLIIKLIQKFNVIFLSQKKIKRIIIKNKLITYFVLHKMVHTHIIYMRLYLSKSSIIYNIDIHIRKVINSRTVIFDIIYFHIYVASLFIVVQTMFYCHNKTFS